MDMINEKKKLVEKINAITNPDLIAQINSVLKKVAGAILSLEQKQTERERKAEYLTRHRYFRQKNL